MKSLATFLSLAALSLSVLAGDNPKDILNYEAQKNANKDVKKIVFIADKRPHGGKGNHEFVAGAMYLAKTINAAYPNAYAVVHTQDKMPKDLSHADAVVVLMNHGGPAVNPATLAAMEKGAGFMAIHFGVEVNKGKEGDAYLKWMGGYFETFYSVNPWWVPKFESIPEHPTTRGVKPFSVRDEWYYHMRFVDGMKGVTPVLSAVAPIETVKEASSARGGNPAVYEAVKAKKPQHMAWAYERPDGGRGFGFTGYHQYSNLENDSFRLLLLNGVAWVTKLEVAKDGVPSKSLTAKDLEALYQESVRIKEQK